MTTLQEAVADFLSQKAIAVAGVSRDFRQPANAIFRKLKAAGYAVYAVNPRAEVVEGEPCYQSLRDVPAQLDAVVAATPPAGTEDIVRECIDLGISRVWMHQGMGPGSISDSAVALARANGIRVIPGACPMMFVDPVDPFHRCARGIKRLRGKLPQPA